jgi:integrase
MAFVTDKEELKPGLIIFRRADVSHRNWYCRVKLPKADRYKTISLKTSDISAARERAFDHDADVRFRLKHDVPVFNRPFAQVAQEYVALQEARAKRGEVSAARPKKIKSVINGPLNDYVGSTQIHLVGHDRWENYPAWRRENGEGRYFRTGVKHRAGTAGGPDKAIVSDSTIRFEMSIFGAVMAYAVSKRYVPASNKFEGKPKLKTMRRDEFTLEEYRHLHTVARSWVKAAMRPSSTWYRTVAYNFILIMCNTGMRPSEAKNLRWRDVTTALDRDKRELVVLFVQGKGKSRKLVAPKSVGDYLERIKEATRQYAREAAKDGNAPEVVFRPEAPVFTTITGDPARSLYQAMIEDLLVTAGLRDGPSGVPRSTYCFRHTYATFRLGEGVDVYFLAEQMGKGKEK